jgi:imidazole glycerol-phosphate synthase subunit HisF
MSGPVAGRADKVSVNSAAVARPGLVGELARTFGEQCITVAIDAKQVGRAVGKFSPTAGVAPPASTLSPLPGGWPILGAGEILLTSMDRDGTRSGYDLPLLKRGVSAVPVPVVASGGVGGLQDLVAGVTEGGASAVLAASLFHFGEAQHRGRKRALDAGHVPVRPPMRHGAARMKRYSRTAGNLDRPAS